MRAWLADSIDDAASFWAGPRGKRAALRHARGPLAALLLIALCAAVYLPGTFTIPAVDRDESRFAQASRQMFESLALPEDQQIEALHSGGIIEPRVADRSRLNKPPLIYWLQTTSAAIFTANNPASDAIWMYRIPSVLAATLAVLFTWRAGLLLFDPRAAVLGAAFLAICPIVVWDAHQARADQLLLACTTVAFWLLAALYTKTRLTKRESWTLPIALAAAVALGILAKGPITPMIALLALIALFAVTHEWKWMRRLRPLTALAVILTIALPWLIAVAAKVGVSDYWAEVFDETVGRSAAPKEGHWGPPGYHLVLLVILFWPGVILTALSITRAVKIAWGQPQTTIADFNATDDDTNLHKSSPVADGGGAERSEAEAVSTSTPSPQRAERRGEGLPQSDEPPSPSGSSPSTEPEAQARDAEDSQASSDPDDLPIPLEPEPEPTPPPTVIDAPVIADSTPPDEPVTVERPPLAVRFRALLHTLTRRPTGRRPELFCLAWIIPAWIIFELVSTKLPHYTMPIYPAIALLSARGLLAALAGSIPAVDSTGTRLGFQLWLLMGALLTVAAPLAIAILGGAGVWVILAAALAAASAALLWLTRDALQRSLLGRAVMLGSIAAVLGLVNIAGVALPLSTNPWLTDALMRTARDAGWTLDTPIAAVSYHEDSLVFATRARLERIDDAADWARANRGLLIAPAGTATILQADTRVRAALIDTVSGYNYSTGKILQLELIDTRP
ncbi:MAG: glycosyltransferase family 39 protein [Planctomycetota bacterium]